MKKKPLLITVSVGLLLLILVFAFDTLQTSKASEDKQPRVRVETLQDQQAVVHLEAPAGRTIMTLAQDGVVNYHFLDSATGVAQTFEAGKLVSRTDVDAMRDTWFKDPVLLPLSDKRELDQFVHRLWTGDAEPNDLPASLSGNYEVSERGEGYEVIRHGIEGVLSSGPSRYRYHYDAPLDEQAVGPTSLSAWYEDDGSITIELTAPSGESVISVEDSQLRVVFSHEKLNEETRLEYEISSRDSVDIWTPNSKTAEDDALITAYLAGLSVEEAQALPPLPEALGERYVVHKTESGFVIEHQPVG